MAVVSSDYLAGLLTNFRLIFERDFKAALAVENWADVALRVPSDTDTESYNWFGTVPKMAEGQVKLGGLEKYNFSIRNKTYKAGLEVKRETIEDDKIGMLAPRLAQLGPEAARHPGELIFNLFESNPLAYDGKALFANDHVIGASGTIDNLQGGTGITVAQVQADLAANRGIMVKWKDDQGRVAGNRANAIVSPPELMGVFWSALNGNLGGTTPATMPAGTGKFQAAGYTVIENPFLTDANDWYLLALSPAGRPFVFQDRLPPALEGITTPNTESGVLLDRFIYTVRARYNVGIGDFMTALKVVNS